MSSYQLRILADRPAASWALDNSFADTSGGGNDATEIGTTREYPSLVAGEGSSRIISATGKIEYPNSVFTNNRGPNPFTLEAWVKPIGPTNQATIMAHSMTSGLILDGLTIKFLVPFVAGTIEVSYPLDVLEAHYVVAVMDGTEAALYINGVQVSVSDISQEIVDSGYAAFAGDELLSGDSVGPGDYFVIDSPAIYSYTLSTIQIQNHFAWGRDVRSTGEIVSVRGGLYHSFSDDRANVYDFVTCDSPDAWNVGYTSDVDISEEGVRPSIIELEDGNGEPLGLFESLPGQLEFSVPFDSGDSISYGKIEWLGEGSFVVDYSFDGVAWTSATNNSIIDIASNMPEDEDEEEVTDGFGLFVRIIFTGGIQDDDSIVNYLSFVVYSNNVIQSSMNSRPGQTTNVLLALNDNQIIEYNDRNGAHINEGLVVIEKDLPGDPDDVLSPNPGFEENVDGWVAVGGTLEHSLAEAYVGEGSALLTPDGATATVEFKVPDQPGLEVLEGESYTWSAWCLAPNLVDVVPSIRWYDENGVLISEGLGSAVEVTDEAWINVSFTEAAPVGSVSAVCSLKISGTPSVSDILYIDEAYFSVPVDSEPADTIMAIELWVMFNSVASPFVLVDTRSDSEPTNAVLEWTGTELSVSGTWTGRLYVNGDNVSTYDLEVERWYHIVITIPEGINPQITVGGDYVGTISTGADIQLGHLAAYEEFPISAELPANDLTGRQLMNEYLGISNIVVNDAGQIGISDPVTDVRIYSFDWAMASGD